MPGKRPTRDKRRIGATLQGFGVPLRVFRGLLRLLQCALVRVLFQLLRLTGLTCAHQGTRRCVSGQSEWSGHPTWRPGTTTIEVLPSYRQGLQGIRQGDRVQILFWMHRLSEGDRARLLAHPHGDASRPRRGVFALRSPIRPNPIGSTVVEVREVCEDGLEVDGLDALDGSPVIDIKISP